MSLGILITCFLDNAWILEGEVKYPSLLGVNKLKTHSKPTNRLSEIVHTAETVPHLLFI